MIDRLRPGAPGAPSRTRRCSQRFADLATTPVPADRATPEALGSGLQQRDRPLAADHPSRRRLRRLTAAGRRPRRLARDRDHRVHGRGRGAPASPRTSTSSTTPAWSIGRTSCAGLRRELPCPHRAQPDPGPRRAAARPARGSRSSAGSVSGSTTSTSTPARARGIEVCPATRCQRRLGRRVRDLRRARCSCAAPITRPAEVRPAAGRATRLIGRETGGRRLGLVGFGAIAREIARRGAWRSGWRSWRYDPFVAADRSGLDRSSASHRSRSRSCWRRVDAVSLHVPLTRGHAPPDRRCGARPDAQPTPSWSMPRAAGSSTRPRSRRALREGRLAGAMLDVFEQRAFAGRAACSRACPTSS